MDSNSLSFINVTRICVETRELPENSGENAKDEEGVLCGGEGFDNVNCSVDDGEEDYSFIVDVSRFASLKRTLKWGGLKLVSVTLTLISNLLNIFFVRKFLMCFLFPLIWLIDIRLACNFQMHL